MRKGKARVLYLIAATLLLSPLPLAAQGQQEPRPEPRPLDEVLKDATAIDRLILEDLQAAGVQPNKKTKSPTFLRRAYLGIAGRIPSLAETRRFLQSRSSDRREQLIEELIRSPGYTSHMFNYWADLLRIKTRLANRTSGEPYIAWIKDAIATDMPYDQMVYELLTASGAAHERGNGATGFLLRDRGMPEASMANTVRTFLGTRLECAQCHDHPFDKWTQREFYEMTAFTGGLRYQASWNETDRGEELKKVEARLREEGDRKALQGLRRIMRNATSGISGSGTGMVRLPKDYKGEQGRPGTWVVADTIFGDSLYLPVQLPKERRVRRGRTREARRRQVGREIDSRSAYAGWLTASDNPRFTTVISNRLWKRVMGLGLIEPVDDLNDETQPSHQKLMLQLEGLMRKVGYDLREFQRVLFHTSLFQREAAAEEALPGVKFDYPGPLLRRMSAEQLWDSMITLAVRDPDRSLVVGREQELERAFDQFEELADMSQAEIQERIDLEMLRNTDSKRYREILDAQRQARREEQQEIRQMERDLAKARRQRDKMDERRLLAELEQRGMPDPMTRPRVARDLRRASEIESPARPGHFLRQFGQSDREEIENADLDANVPQVLSLMNGFAEDRILRRSNSLLMRSLNMASRKQQKIRVAFLSTLNRLPTASELKVWHRDFENEGDQAIQDLVWTLLNSNEFRFIQ
ncbi:MAG: DUF1549 domain-containing protein [Planctomycetota bacterium]|jgi:hypothetical protein